MEMQPLSCCSPTKNPVLLGLVPELSQQYFGIGQYWRRQWLGTRLLYQGAWEKVGPGCEAIICIIYCKRSKLEVGEGLGMRLGE